MNNYHNIPAMALAGAEQWATVDAIVDGEFRLTYGETAALMVRVARSLIARGIKPGDRVALWAPNAIAWVPAALGIQAAGAWLVPVNTRLKAEEVLYILDKTQASMLVTVKQFLGVDYVDVLRKQAPDAPVLSEVVELPGPGELETPAWNQFLSVGDSVDEAEVHARIEALRPDDISDIIFTSGTTSMPKGVMLRHQTSLKGYGLLNEAFGVDGQSRYLITSPFFHCFGYKAGWMMAMMVGATSYPMAVFDGHAALELIASAGITHLAGSPTMFNAMLDDPGRGEATFSSVRSAIISASTIPEVLVRRVRKEMDIDTTLTAYGLTESHGFVSTSHPSDAPDTIVKTAGQVISELDAKVVDDDGRELPPGEEGELLVKGFMVMSGYYDDDQATADAVIDGWLHTGDVVRMDENRYLKIVDRKKDIYIMGGFNVSPADVEQVILQLPGVAQTAVVGAPDEKFGEVGAAFVILNPDSELAEQAVIEHCRGHLANYKVPRYVEFIDAFPLNATGKVLKRELRDRIAASLADQNRQE